MTESQDPMVQGRRLRGELRRARQTAHLTQKEVADSLEWSASKLIRIERGAVGISITDLRALLQSYGVTDEQRVNSMVEMARASKRPAWWTKYRHLYTQPFLDLLGYEGSMTTLRQNESGVMPGLLQTEDYARAVITSYTNDPASIEDRVAARMDRQAMLERDDPPEMAFIIDEAVLRRWVGGPAIMRNQLEWLREMGSRPNVAIQVIPFSVGEHPGMKGSFALYEFPPDEDEDYVVFLEDVRGFSMIRNDSGEATVYLDKFLELEKQATRPERLDEMIDDAIASIRPRDKIGMDTPQQTDG